MEQLDAVLAESSLKDRHSKAKEHRGKVTEWWASIEKMTRSLRGANHPVVAFMLKEGQAGHKSRQSLQLLLRRLGHPDLSLRSAV